MKYVITKPNIETSFEFLPNTKYKVIDIFDNYINEKYIIVLDEFNKKVFIPMRSIGMENSIFYSIEELRLIKINKIIKK